MDGGSSAQTGPNTFASHRAELAADVVELLRVPPYAQADLNLATMANYLPLLWPLLDELDPKRVCEIGAAEGATTAVLAEWCRTGGRSLTVVDPVSPTNVTPDAVVTLVPKLSLDYLADAPPADLYLVDGDHNLYTVSRELAGIAERTESDATVLVLVHDVAWPCGRRDMYYDPETIPAEARRPIASNRPLTLQADESEAVGLPSSEFQQAEPGGEQGILTAVEQFLAGHDDWRSCSIPSVHGLALLWHPGQAGQALRQTFDDLAQTFARWEPFLATLEFNRLSLIEQRERDGQAWRDDQAAIAALAEELDGLRREQQRHAVLWQQQQEYISALEQEREQLRSDIARQAAMWARQQDLVDELTGRITALSGELARVRTPLGWVRSRLRR